MSLHKENIEPNLNTLLASIRKYNKDCNLQVVKKAFKIASSAHADQFRQSGEPYFIHPFNVAMILASLELDNKTIAVGLLHDVVEDCSITLDEIKEDFGNTIASILDGVTKISKLTFKTREEFQAENLRKLLFAMVRDIRVILVKLADRLHNVRTLGSLPLEKQKRIAHETLEIYVPLANRLGMYQLKSEMEDISFRHAEPELAKELDNKISKDLEERQEFIKDVINKIKHECDEMNISVDVNGRAKNLFSIYTKIKKDDKNFSQIYDIFGVRVIVNSLQDCYSVLGIAHKIWKPIPGRFKDYIAMPKMNMYQSLHTTIMHSSGEPVEIQIRTSLMDRVAEGGIAAHWNYKESKTKTTDEVKQEIAWLRRLINWHRDLKDAQEYIETIKLELYKDEVFVFTPQGDVKALVSGATPLDFAYLIHTEVGNHCVGAKVNNKIVPHDTVLKNGDIVEVLTLKNATPSQDWLSIVKSNQARHKIRAYFKNEERSDDFKKGKDLLHKEWKEAMKNIAPFYTEKKIENFCADDNFDLNKCIKSNQFDKVLKELNFKALDNFLIQLGRGEITIRNLFNKLFPEWNKEQDPRNKLTEKFAKKKVEKKSKSIQGIIVSGIGDMLIKFAKCCNPVPGDTIEGFITRGKGITIHRDTCKILRNKTESERLVEVQWDEEFLKKKKANYYTKIRIEAIDRHSLLHNITNLVHNMKMNIYELHAESKKNRLATIEFSLEIPHISLLPEFLKNLRKVDGVLRVYRIST